MQTLCVNIPANGGGGGDMGWPEEAQPLFADRTSLDGFLAARAMVGEAGGWGDINMVTCGLYGNCSRVSFVMFFCFSSFVSNERNQNQHESMINE